MKNLAMILAAALLCALPFLLRPERKTGEWREGDPVLVVVTPHIASIRDEFAAGFSAWHQRRFGRPVRIDWRNIGGTTEIMRYLAGEYASAFGAWARREGMPWPDGANPFSKRPPVRAPERSDADWIAESNLWNALRATDDPDAFTCKIDVFFGGGSYDHSAAEAQGLTVQAWPDGEEPRGVFSDEDGVEMLPRGLGGEIWRGRAWHSAVLSGFGICSNPDRLLELGITNADGTAKIPSRWKDLTDPRLAGQVAVSDPTKSGSIAKAFEMILHSAMRDRMLSAGFDQAAIDAAEREIAAGREPPRGYAETISQGWLDGIELLRGIGANARYFTDAAGKPPQDVSAGDAAAGICIDFYGRVQSEVVRRDSTDRLVYVTPKGGSSISGDPISLLRGAERRLLATRFMEFVLSEDGQKLWNGRPGTPGGPERHALRRLPARRDFYPDPAHPGVDARAKARAGTTSDDLLDPSIDAYSLASAFTYEPRWTASHFGFLRTFVRAMCMDAGDELHAAWRRILECGGPEACPQAMAALRRLPSVPYPVDWDHVTRAVRDPSLAKGLSTTDVQTEWTKFFRRSYREAEEIAAREKAARAARY